MPLFFHRIGKPEGGSPEGGQVGLYIYNPKSKLLTLGMPFYGIMLFKGLGTSKKRPAAGHIRDGLGGLLCLMVGWIIACWS